MKCIEHNRLLPFFAVFILLFFSCSKKHFAEKSTYEFRSNDGNPDYSDLHYWAAHPWKWDPSDSIPKPLRDQYAKDSIADVFYLYPTSLTAKKDLRWNAPIDDIDINKKTDYTAILYQASAFSEKTRLFAPRYRQAHIRSYFEFQDNNAQVINAFELAYTDIKSAFIYYMEHYNNGRPIILACHSQGTTHGARLLKEFFEGKPLMKQLVCAYLVGMPTPDNYFSQIPSCKDSGSVGCYVGWRTYKRGYIDTIFVTKETFKSNVTNPLLWTSDTSFAPSINNKGAVLKNFNKVYSPGVDAQIYNNVLWTSRPKFFGDIFLTNKNYHIADINLFYLNIAANVKYRIAKFMEKNR
ncbi:MAG TPA: DUF3089 domain-containing protein [Ferruginibacter sp.]|nr:DUF3089 domain-containing protein [Ferruginibacter sp.]